jgi:hypothetical protein
VRIIIKATAGQTQQCGSISSILVRAHPDDPAAAAALARLEQYRLRGAGLRRQPPGQSPGVKAGQASRTSRASPAAQLAQARRKLLAIIRRRANLTRRPDKTAATHALDDETLLSLWRGGIF